MAKKATEAPSKEKSKALAPAASGSTALAEDSKQATKAVARTGTKIAGKGFENLEREDILLPRLKLLQPLSPEVTGDMAMEAGTILLNLSSKNLGKELVITPILHYRSRIKWIPRDDGGGIDCSSADAKVPKDTKLYSTTCSACPHKDWDEEAEKKKDKQPKCTLYENFIVLIGDSTEPVILPMERTKTKAARRFYSTMALKGGDMFDWTYKLGTFKDKNSENQSYFNYTVQDTGKKVDTERRAVCDRLWAQLSAAVITSNVEHPDEGGAAPVGAAAAGTNSKF